MGSCNYNDFQNHCESHHHSFVFDVPSQGSSSRICISTLHATWLFSWPHKRSAYRLHIFQLLCIYLLTLHCSWLNFDFSLVFMLHPLITNFNRRGNLRGNKQSKSTRTSPPQKCTETNLDMEWQGVNNDGNFEQGPIAEKGTVFVEQNFCKSDQLVNDISYFATTSMRLAWPALGSTEEDQNKCFNFSCNTFALVQITGDVKI